MKRSTIVFLLSVSCGGSSSALPDETAEGAKGGPCYPNNTCNAGLTCAASRCTEADSGAADTGGTAVEDTSLPADTGVTDGASDTASADTSRPAYVESSIAAACDMLGDGTNVSGANGDDESSGKAALPFAFQYFGAPVTQWSMASNGFAQLWASPSGGVQKTPNNVAIPSADEPNGMLAPFWDDLVPMFSEARSGTLGTAPNRRFVISWVHWTIKGDASTRLTFQAKLFETTGVIEFHYCAMAPDGNARATGSSATIGLENLTGTAGVMHSFSAAAAVASGKALRFMP